MKEFFAYLLQFGRLTQPQQDLIAHQASRVTLRKGDYFVAQQVGFVEAGVLRVGSYTEQGEELTSYFIEEQHPLLDIRPPEAAGTPSPCLAQALTHCQLVVFSAQQWQAFAQLIPGWEVITQKILAQALRVKMERVLPLVVQDAAARYRSFLITYPHLANRVPLAYVAAYLGMTQSSLSRIRKNI
ncbi:Crp/Fnr family transcriptional regulator [Hymenobacter psoromatis]|uniref:Crp/Fnr family transcriptional regulator n=1 Tax=Hymenobacter psoromatis TaxID=1484116 RepID=UPI001CBAAB3B|nr:Crp/Fnr family transcriptional regulator [Hymenobacter psoromatis]